jgi:hypothetical protein
MTTDTRTLMTSIGATTVAEILGEYTSLLDEKHDLELAALALRNEGESLASTRALLVQQRLRDTSRRLGIYEQLSIEVELLMGVPA